MEDPVAPRPARHRVRVHRQKSVWERTTKFLAMPHLKRRDRNQRVAIVLIILFMGLYLVVLRPLFVLLFPTPPPKRVVVPAGKLGGPKRR